MQLRARTLLLSLALAPLSYAANAQQVTDLPMIDVEGALASAVQTGHDQRKQSPNAKLVIEGEQLNQFADMSLGDALRRLPGITFPRANRSRDIKLRGMGKEYTQVLLDGRPLVDGDSSRNMEVDRIPAIFVERIEIIRSPLASQDSQGAAGTINIITRRNFGKNGGGITVGSGHVENFGTPAEVSGWTGGNYGAVSYFMGAGYQRRLLEESSLTSNYNSSGSNPLGTNPNRRTTQDQKRTFDEYTAMGRFEYRANDQNSFIFSPTYLRTDEARAQTEYRTNAAMVFTDRRTTEMRMRSRESIGGYFEWAHTFNNAVSGRVFLDLQEAREDTTRNGQQETLNSSGTVTATSPVNSFNPVVLSRMAPGASMVANLNGHRVESGFGLNQLKRGENDSGRTDGSRTYDIKEDIYYGYLSDSFSVFGPDKLTAGVRIEHATTNVNGFAGANNEKTETDFNPSLQYRYSITSDLDFRTGIARTVRRPDLRELTPTVRTSSGTPGSPDTRGNPNASSEKIWGADVGLDYYFYDRLGILSANFFSRSFENKLERRLTYGYEGNSNRWISELRNLGDGKAFGLELDARVPLRMINAPHLTLWGNATFVKTELHDPTTGQDRRFAEQPNTIVNVGLDYYVERWNTTFGVNYNRSFGYSQDILLASGGGATPVLINERTEYNNLNRFDLTVKTQLAKNWSLSFSALNVTRPMFRTKQITSTAAGATDTVVNYEEPSRAVYYVRSSYTW